MKTWDYDEITKTAETWIAGYMDEARVCGTWEAAQQKVDHAYGMWLLWRALTHRRGQKSKDRLRLYALTVDEEVNSRKSSTQELLELMETRLKSLHEGSPELLNPEVLARLKAGGNLP